MRLEFVKLVLVARVNGAGLGNPGLKFLLILASLTADKAGLDAGLDLQAASRRLVVVGCSNVSSLDVCFDPHCVFLL
jgi:hypothetical protein